MKDKKIFTPLNISYVIQKYSNRLILGGLLSIIIFVAGLIVVMKMHSDLAFSPIFGSTIFVVLALLFVLYFTIFVFRKVGLQEGEKLRLYKEMLDHESTTINDLWDVMTVDNNLFTFADDSAKIFLRCEKGYLVSRPKKHQEIHQRCVEQFLKSLLDKGYYIDYYNWRNRDANTAPLDDLEDKLRSNPNKFLKEYGSATIKFCRELEYGCTDSEVEYFIITSRDPHLSPYLESSVEASVECLQGSLYEDVRICGINEFVKFVEEFHKISGINVNALMSGNMLNTEQEVVKIIKVYGLKPKENVPQQSNEDAELYEKFLAEFNELEQQSKESLKRKKNSNLVKRNGTPVVKPNAITPNKITQPKLKPVKKVVVEDKDDDLDLDANLSEDIEEDFDITDWDIEQPVSTKSDTEENPKPKDIPDNIDNFEDDDFDITSWDDNF